MAGDGKGRALHSRALRALAAFFIIMMIFTVVSRVTSSLTMAWVTAERPAERKIEHNVYAEGSVEKNREFAVLTESGILVKTVCVVPGQKVAQGETLAELDKEHLAEQIQRLREEIEILRLTGESAARAQQAERRAQQTAKTRAVEDAQLALGDAQALYEAAAAEHISASDAYHSYESAHVADAGDEAVYAQLLALQETMKAKQAACDDAFRRLRDAQLAAERAKADANVEDGADDSAGIQAIRMEQKERELAGLEELQQAGGVVTAPADGIVTEVYLATGQMTTETAAVTMADPSSGLRYQAQVGRQDAAYVSVGAGVTLEKNSRKYEGLTIDVVQNNEDGSCTVTVNLDAETPLSIGDTASMEIRQVSGPYRTVVPAGALHVENGNYYVYVVEEEAGVIGKQYQLRRVDVRVRDQNHLYAALEEGALSSESLVVTDCDRYVEAGSRVRLREP